MDFVNRGPAVEIEPLCKAMAEMLAGDLSSYPGVRVLERAKVQQFLTESDLTPRRPGRCRLGTEAGPATGG